MAIKIFVIGMVWPEPTSSGAGTRTIQLIELFLANGFDITFASAASKSDFSYDLKSIGVKEEDIKLNDSGFNSLIKELKPDIVLFDRFMTEEQYGWRVDQECPDAFKILDTIDLHLLRNARQQTVKKGAEATAANLFTDVAMREIAAILRTDLSLMIGEAEIEILRNQFKIDESLLYYLPFLENEITDSERLNWPSFEMRKDFVFIGNFLHEPNWHAVQTLKTKIWPTLSKKLPQARLHIYGAYASQKVLQLHQPKSNFYIMGRADDARATVSVHRVLLAPILFGAGAKGKIIDAMQTGTPTVTTTVGAESMQGDLLWNGYITDDTEQFIEHAVALYENEALWYEAQENGINIINFRYSKFKFQELFITKINQMLNNLSAHRDANFFGRLLKHHTLQSTKYMSLWIEEKNK